MTSNVEHGPRTAVPAGLVGVATFLLAALCFGQTAGLRSDWTEFHRTNMERLNPYETVLNVKNVRRLALKWSFKASPNVYSSPAVVNGVVYFGSEDDGVYAISARTGTLVWSHYTNSIVDSSPAVANGVVYIGSVDDKVYATKGYKTETMWLYDGRSNVPHITKKDRPLTPEHCAEFEECFGADPNGRAKRRSNDSKEDRWHCFSIDEVKNRDFKIDSLKWLKDDLLDGGDEVLEPDELATDALAELESAITELKLLTKMLENGDEASPLAESVETARS
jgi:hypothetical protein